MIGDTLMLIPPESIRNVTQLSYERIPVMRSKGTMAKDKDNAQQLLEITLYFYELVILDIIDNDCYVLDGDRLLKFFGSDKRVVRGINENGNTIVPYKYGKAEHFVVVNERKEIVFNSLENSTCVRLGEPVWDKARYLA